MKLKGILPGLVIASGPCSVKWTTIDGDDSLSLIGLLVYLHSMAITILQQVQTNEHVTQCNAVMTQHRLSNAINL